MSTIVAEEPRIRYYLEDLVAGMSVIRFKEISDADISAFAEISGDHNPLHLEDEFASATRFGRRIAHGMLTGSLITGILGTELPGPGGIYLSQSLKFCAPVFPGDVVETRVEVTRINSEKSQVTLACTCSVEGKLVLDGEALILVPARQ